MFKKIIISLYLFGSAFSAYSQAINRQINFTISSASYNQTICSGGVPKFKLEYRIGSGGALNSHFFTTSGTVCNSDVALTGFSQTVNNFCDNDIEINLTGWYERGGNASAFNSGVDTNFGEILSYYINPRAYANSASIPLTLSNGNVVTFDLIWSNTASTINVLTGGATCRQSDNVITLSSGTGSVNFRWYSGVSGGSGTGPFYLGTVYTMPKSNFASGSNFEYYAAEVVSSTCEKEPKYQSFSIVDNPVAPVASVSSFAICAGNTVSIPLSVYIPGSTIEGYYDATLNTKAGPDVMSGNFVTYVQNNSSNIYFRTRNSQGCYSLASSSPVTITTTPKPQAPRTADLTVCAETSYALTASNPNFPITYIWKDINNNILRNSTISQLNDEFFPGIEFAGTYNYYVQNSVPNSNNTGQCFSDNTPVKLVVHAIPPAPTNIAGDTICEGDQGNLIFTPTSNASVKWYENASDLTPVMVGNSFVSYYLYNARSYYATQTINNCESPKSTANTISVVPPLTAPQVKFDTVCENKMARLSMNQYDSATQYLWHDNSIGGNELAVGRLYTTPELSATKSYYAMYRYGNCYSNRSEVIATVNPLPVPMNYRANNPCEYDTLKIWVDSLPNCTYSWLGTNNGYTSSMQNPVITNALESEHQGEYQLMATNTVTGCVSKPVSVYPDIIKKPDNFIITHNSPKCETETIQLDAPTIIGASYQWWGVNGYSKSIKNPTIPNVKVINQGLYKLQITIKGCKSDTISSFINVYPNPKPFAGGDTFMYEGDSIRLSSSGGVTYNWTASPYLDFQDIRNPLVKPKLGFHLFELTVYDDKGCKEKDSVYVTVYPTLELNIKDVITPNGDGLNDYWKIDFIQNHFIANVKVISLSGHIVFQTDKYENNWSGEGLPGGDYFFIVHTLEKDYKGTITLVK
jgi:gliding motility-associated-like protein